MKLIKVLVLAVLVSSCSVKYSRRKPVFQEENQPKQEVIYKETKKKSEPKLPKTEKIEATSVVRVTPEIIQEYIKNYKDIAIVEMQRYKIPASITLAQAILESGSGKGSLAVKANNHFGIKCHVGWQGDSVEHDDDDKGECFRKYARVEESFEDHSQFLVNRPRYAFLFQLASDDYKGWAEGLKTAGYATDPKYPAKLISLIERYKLYQYDQEALGKEVTQTPITEKNEVERSQRTVVKPVEPRVVAPKIYVVKQGDTLYGISKKTNVSVENLMKINRLSSELLQIGQKLKLK